MSAPNFDPTRGTLWDLWAIYPRDHIKRPSQIETNLRMVEKLMGTPPICDITDDWLAELRDKATDQDYAPRTIRTAMKQVQTLMRYLAPRIAGNPRGLGIIDTQDIPYARMPRVNHKMPRRITLQDLSLFYVACIHATKPRNKGIPAADLWRTMSALAYCTGMRRGDLFTLTWSQVDFGNRCIQFTAEKTGKDGVCPLPQYAIEHLQRIRIGNDPDGLVFRGWWKSGGGSMYDELREICRQAKIEPFTLHDLRRTAACEIERVRHGLSGQLLQHAPRGVTAMHYLNEIEELREAVEAMRVPVGFKAATKMHERREQERQKAELAMKLDPQDFDSDVRPDKSEWRFSVPTLRFRFRGHWYSLPTKKQIVILRLLVNASKPVSRKAIYDRLVADCGYELAERRVACDVDRLRRQLKNQLGLKSSGWDPVPRIGDHSAKAACWTVHIPKHLQPTQKPLRSRRKSNEQESETPTTNPKDWKLDDVELRYRYRGQWHNLKSKRSFVVLKTLVRSGQPVTREELHKRLTDCGDDAPEEKVALDVARLRKSLKRQLDLPKDWDPVPCLSAAKNRSASWMLHLPATGE